MNTLRCSKMVDNLGGGATRPLPRDGGVWRNSTETVDNLRQQHLRLVHEKTNTKQRTFHLVKTVGLLAPPSA